MKTLIQAWLRCILQQEYPAITAISWIICNGLVQFFKKIQIFEKPQCPKNQIRRANIVLRNTKLLNSDQAGDKMFNNVSSYGSCKVRLSMLVNVLGSRELTAVVSCLSCGAVLFIPVSLVCASPARVLQSNLPPLSLPSTPSGNTYFLPPAPPRPQQSDGREEVQVLYDTIIYISAWVQVSAY